MTALEKFYSDPPGTEMLPDDVIFQLVWDDVIDVSYGKDGDEGTKQPIDLTPDEMHVFRKCLESGLSCWSEVVELALMAATSERSRS